MSSSPRFQQLAVRSYSLVKSTGLMETAFGRGVFQSVYFLYKRWVEDNLAALVASRPELLRGGNVLDIGANVGYTVSVLARGLDAGYKVYGFEPEPANFKSLQEVAARRSLRDKVAVFQCAVGAAPGTVDLFQNLQHPADHRVITGEFRSLIPGVTGIRVPLVSIDDFLARNPGPVSFVKIDVQGFEFPVCQGMIKTLELNPALTLVLEYAPSALRELGFDPRELIEFLVARGFQGYEVHPHGVISLGIPNLREEDYVDLLFSRAPLACGKSA